MKSTTKIVRYYMNALHWSRQAISVSFDWESKTAIEKAENCRAPNKIENNFCDTLDENY